MEFYDPVRQIIDHNLSYRDRREVIAVMSESTASKDRVYANISNYFYKKMTDKNMMPYLAKYADSKGNVEKYKGYEETLTSLQYLKADPRVEVSRNAQVVEESFLNLKARRKVFELSYKGKESALGKLMYAALLKACVATTSLLIADSGIVNGTVTRKPVEAPISVEGLSLFNTFCKNGTFDKMMRYELNIGNRAVREAGLIDAIGDAINLGVSVASAFITAIRSLVYWVYYTRIDLADYLEQQAAYIEMNRKALENRTDLDPKKKKEIIEKQKEWELRLLKLSDRIQVDDIKAARKAKADADKDAKDMKAADATGTDNSDDDSQTGGQEVPDFF